MLGMRYDPDDPSKSIVRGFIQQNGFAVTVEVYMEKFERNICSWKTIDKDITLTNNHS